MTPYFLADSLRQKLSPIDGIRSTDDGVEKCGIISFIADQLEPTAIKQALSKQQINVSTSKGAGSLVSFEKRGLKEVVRAYCSLLQYR